MSKKILLTLAIAFSLGFTLQAQVLEDFETWNPYMVSGVQLTEPVDWSGADSFVVGVGLLLNPTGTYQAQIFQDNPGQAGTGALRISSKPQDAILAVGMPAKSYPSIATNSLITVDAVNSTFSQVGGTTINSSPTITTMYIKNTTVGGDTTFILAQIIDDSDGGDSIVATADTMLTANIASFTQITLPFQYTTNTNLTPTIVRYTISSGNPLALLDSTNQFSVHDGTEIIVDNIDIASPNGVRQYINQKQLAKVYPTIKSNVLYIDLISTATPLELELYSIDGQLIKREFLNKRMNTISINDLSVGSYIYSIKENGVVYQTGKFVH